MKPSMPRQLLVLVMLTFSLGRALGLEEGSPKLHSAGFSAGLTLGEEAVATCTVKKSSPGPFALSWHKDGLEIEGGTGRVSVATKATSTMLSIDAIGVEDIGNYSCVARNAFGTESLTLPLIISASFGG